MRQNFSMILVRYWEQEFASLKVPYEKIWLVKAPMDYTAYSAFNTKRTWTWNPTVWSRRSPGGCKQDQIRGGERPKSKGWGSMVLPVYINVRMWLKLTVGLQNEVNSRAMWFLVIQFDNNFWPCKDRNSPNQKHWFTPKLYYKQKRKDRS